MTGVQTCALPIFLYNNYKVYLVSNVSVLADLLGIGRCRADVFLQVVLRKGRGRSLPAFRRRNPDARLDATAECSFDEEAGWHAVIRGVWLQEKEPTAADLAACQDMSRTFLLPTDGATGSRSLAWLPGSRVVWRAPTPTTGAATYMRIWRGPMSFPSRQWKAWGQAPRNRTIPKAAFLSPAVPWRSSSC